MKPNWTKWLAPALGLVLLVTALVVLHHSLQKFKYREVIGHLQAMPLARVWAALALTAFSYAILSGYDLLALRYPS